MTSYLNSLLLVLLSGFCTNTLAYEPDKGHETLGKLSFIIYRQCYGETPLFSQRAIDLVITGNKAMDTGLPLSLTVQPALTGEAVFSPVTRVFNWHFYHPGREPFARAGLVNQSMSHLWRLLLEGLASDNGEHHYLFLGGLLHLLEDISVPAHGVPVYHGPTAVAWLGPRRFAPLVQTDPWQAVLKDPVDGMPVDGRRLLQLMQSAGMCPSAMTPGEIRQQQHQELMRLLDKPIEACVGFTWHHFWLPPEEGDYFGEYLSRWNQPAFGEAGRLFSDEGEVCDMRPADRRYDDFLLSLHALALQGNLRLLRWFALMNPS